MHWLTNFLTPPPPSDIPRRLFQVGGSRGLVVQYSATFKASVRTGGGGGYLNKGTGYIFPVWSQTDHVHYQEFWLRRPDGQEDNYWLQGYEGVKLRQGHEVGVLLIDGVLTYVMNYSTGTLHTIAPLSRLLPLQTPMGGCASVALALPVGSMLGSVLWFLVNLLVHLLVHGTFGLETERPGGSELSGLVTALGPLCWLGAVLGASGYLLRRSRRARARNAALWAQGRAELDAACRRCLDVDPAE